MKHLLKNTLSIFILTLASTCQVFSQEIVVNKILPPDGQSFAEISGFAQDQNGFMWISTRNGLYRYDGYQFIHYKNNPLDPNSLVSDMVISIAIDLNGKIWLGTNNGLDQFDPVTGLFKHYRNDPEKPGSLSGIWIDKLLIDQEGILWVGSAEGLERYDEKKDSFIHYRNIPNYPSSLSFNNVSEIYEDKQGTIWVGTGLVWLNGEEYKRGGLNRMDKKKGTFTRYMHDPDNPESLINNIVTAIYEDSNGKFWVGSAGDGLHSMDRKKETFTRHTYDPKHPEKLSRPPFNEKDQPREHISFIKEDNTGAIWIGTFGSGLVYYNPETKTKKSGNDFKDVQIDNTPGCIFSSKEGVIWIGTDFGNIYRIDPFNIQIPHFETSNDPVRSFYVEPNGTLWIGTENVIIRNNKVNGIIKRNVIDVNPAIDMNGIMTIFGDKQGTIWLGTREGLAQWDRNTESYLSYPNVKGPIWSIYEDRDSNLWIGTNDNLSLFNRKTGKSTPYQIYPKEDTANSQKNSISSVFQDKTGKLWVGTWISGGINLFNPETGKFKTYLDGKGIGTICEDADGILWIGGFQGFYKYDHDADEFIQFTETNKTSEFAQITSIFEDNQKNLWIGTFENKLIRLNPQRNAVVIYDKKNGIENSLLWNSAYKDQNGNLYFGDETGYFSLDPKKLTNNIVPPNIVFTDFLLNETPIKPGNDSPIRENLFQAKEIRLTYNQNVFTFEFAALDYSNPEETKYSCMLENYDTDWRKGNSERRAYYFNVPPGKYEFHVKAVTRNGAWAEKKIDVIILPPWWRTWWAYCIYGLILIVAVFGIDRFQRVRLLKAEKERNRERELAQAKEIEKAYLELGKAHETLKSTQSQLIQSEKMASLGELTAGIAHEIQNPLNFVNNFSEVSKELIGEMNEELAIGNMQLAKEIAGDIEQNLEKINHHGKRAADIVKGMLQHSRTSSGVKEPTDINALADEYLRLAYHGLRAKDKSFNADFKTEFDESLPKINVISQDIGRVLLNLINNAFYAVDKRAWSNDPLTPKGELKNDQNIYRPTVTVSTTSSKSPSGDSRLNDAVGQVGVKISVKDNGPGINKNIVDKIFQPFFTTKPTGQGTGLGLSLSYDIVKAHGGEIKVETKEGEGTEFIIQLPIN